VTKVTLTLYLRHDSERQNNDVCRQHVCIDVLLLLSSLKGEHIIHCVMMAFQETGRLFLFEKLRALSHKLQAPNNTRYQPLMA
jgi:hypothetical protein